MGEQNQVDGLGEEKLTGLLSPGHVNKAAAIEAFVQTQTLKITFPLGVNNQNRAANLIAALSCFMKCIMKSRRLSDNP